MVDSSSSAWKRWIVWLILPYGIGLFLSHANLGGIRNLLAPLLVVPKRRLLLQKNKPTTTTPMDVEQCWTKKLLPAIQTFNFDNLQIALHRNGQAQACANSTGNNIFSQESMKEVLTEMSTEGLQCPEFNQKYPFESFLTRCLHKLSSACHSGERQRSESLGFYGFCDMGEAFTPILFDHSQHVPNTFQGKPYLPCHFHDDTGVRVTSLSQLSDLASSTVPESSSTCSDGGDTDGTCQGELIRTLHLYAVPAGRVFMHVPQYVGQIIHLPHVKGGDSSKPVYLEVLSVSPAIFDLHNFFTKEESDELVAGVLKEQRESHRIKRSETGVNDAKTLNRKRTSESGFDTDSKVAVEIKKRCFDVLGFDEYIESFSDGLQILRYNLTKAYIPHMDYLDISPHTEHDYDSSKQGGNRFATILLYMTDLEPGEGGETVFVNAWPSGQAEEDHVQLDQALKELRESDQSGIVEEGSWEEKMVAQCRTKLALRPQSGRAVLFYSQLPNGREDSQSLHGGCPVLSGTKYAANLWVWNTPRDGFPGNPRNPKYKDSKKQNQREAQKETEYVQIQAVFRNTGKDRSLDLAKLFYFDGNAESEWGDLGPDDDPLSINTYIGHVWRVKVGEELKKTFTITTDKQTHQEFEI